MNIKQEKKEEQILKPKNGKRKTVKNSPPKVSAIGESSPKRQKNEIKTRQKVSQNKCKDKTVEVARETRSMKKKSEDLKPTAQKTKTASRKNLPQQEFKSPLEMIPNLLNNNNNNKSTDKPEGRRITRSMKN